MNRSLVLLVLVAGLAACCATTLTAQKRAPRSFGSLAAAIGQATREGDWTAGETAASEALGLRPHHPELLFHRAYFRARLGREVDALADLGRVADLGLALPVKARFAKHLSEEALKALEARFAANSAERGRATVGPAIGPADLEAECMVHEARRNRLFIGGARRQEVWTLDKDGQGKLFLKRGTAGIWSIGALAIDAESDLLWVASSASRRGLGTPKDIVGRAGLFAFRLRDGALAHRILVPGELGIRDLVGLAVLDKDTLVASCRFSGEILRFDRRREKVTTLVRRGAFARPRSIVPIRGEPWILVSDDEGPLRRVNVRTGEARALRSPPRYALYRLRDLQIEGQNIYALQTGLQPSRLLRIRLNRSVTGVLDCEVLATSLASLDRPRGLVRRGQDWGVLATTGAGRGAKPARLDLVTPVSTKKSAGPGKQPAGQKSQTPAGTGR